MMHLVGKGPFFVTFNLKTAIPPPSNGVKRKSLDEIQALSPADWLPEQV